MMRRRGAARVRDGHALKLGGACRRRGVVGLAHVGGAAVASCPPGSRSTSLTLHRYGAAARTAPCSTLRGAARAPAHALVRRVYICGLMCPCPHCSTLRAPRLHLAPLHGSTCSSLYRCIRIYALVCIYTVLFCFRRSLMQKLFCRACVNPSLCPPLTRSPYA